MANRTPHVVGGGLGTFRKEAQKRHEQGQTRKQKEAVQRNKQAMHKIAKASK
jgi:hypothetical protein